MAINNRITRVFLDVDLRNGHEGLEDLASQNKVNIRSLKSGEHVIFLNTRRTGFKLYSSNGVLSYYKSSGKIDLNAIGYIPEAFTGNGKMDFAKAELAALKKKLNIK